MRRAGFLLLLAGWVVIVVAVAVFSSNVSRSIFVVLGLIVEALGLVGMSRALRQTAGARE
jgi:hypothetical protein